MIHSDTPFDIWSPNHENDFIDPAVKSTEAILKGCADFGVKRLILTSSTACVVQPWITNIVHNETNWIDVNSNTTAFPKAKY